MKSKDFKKLPRDGKSRHENLASQPLHEFKIFNNPDVITEGWYPVCPSKEIRADVVKSFTILNQRFIIYRGKSGQLHAMDAFCPHMGADLGNGQVIGEDIQCYFHQWSFDPKGALASIRCQEARPKEVKIQDYPVDERYGFIWIYSGPHAPYTIPHPPGLEKHEVSGILLMSPNLFVHHHVLMASGIDLQHFASVHNLDVDFEYVVKEKDPGWFEWDLEGVIPSTGWKLKLARKIFGDKFGYQAKFAGGSVVTLTYGPRQYLFGKGRKIPPVHILWGCVPQQNAVSKAYFFLVFKKRKGFIGRIKNGILFLVTVILLYALRDDDVRAFPNMRFQAKNLITKDQSVARFIQLTETLKVSAWSKNARP